MTAGEERLAGPVGREMKPETSDARDFEQMETKRADGRRRQSRAREDRTSEVREQQQREAVQLQATRVGAEAMTAEAIRVDVELELLDPILRRAPVVIPRNEIGGAARSPAAGTIQRLTRSFRGRPKGSRNKVYTEARKACAQLVDDPEYRAKLRKRLLAGKLAPQLETMLWY